MRELEKYVGECFSINYERNKNRFCIFTIPTQHFYIESLSELTPNRFDLEVQKQKENQALTTRNLNEVFQHGVLTHPLASELRDKKLNQNKDE